MKTLDYILNKYIPFDDLEKIDLDLFKKFVSKYQDKIFDFIPNQPFICASAIVINPEFTKTLIMYHKLHKTFRQFGGKAEGNSNLSLVASNELLDESGATGKLVSNTPLDLIRWNFPSRTKNGILYPAKDCFDIAFLFVMDEKTKIKPNKQEVSETKWMPLEEWRDFHDSENEVVKANPNELSYHQRTYKKIQLIGKQLGIIR